MNLETQQQNQESRNTLAEEVLRSRDVSWVSSPPNFLEMFTHHLRTVPLRPVCSKINCQGDQFSAESISYEEVAEKASYYVKIFQRYAQEPNTPILFSISDPRHLLTCLVATMSAGLTAVPLQSVEEFINPRLFRERIKSVVGDCHPRLVIVDDKSRWERGMGDTAIDVPIVDIKTLEQEAAVHVGDVFDFNSATISEWAIIQYTSGSTGSPKGVVLTHQNLASNIVSMGQVTDPRPDDRWISWLPLHHDMGLISCLLFCAYWKIDSYFLSPIDFITRPLSWLQVMSQFRGTLAIAPNFAYSLCLHKLSDQQLEGLDLSAWRRAYCAAEPINHEHVKKFIARFSRYGFGEDVLAPAYGLAEGTVAASATPIGVEMKCDHVDRNILAQEERAVPIAPDSPSAVTFVSVGYPLPGHQITITKHETGAPCGEREVGEITFTGPSVSPYYFHEYTPTTRSRTILRTGDLGYMADGHVYVIDRIKDLIIIAGQNFAPSDIERQLTETKGLRRGRVATFAYSGDVGTETLNVIAEIDPRTWRRQRRITKEISQKVRRHFGLNVERVILIPPGMMPKTTSGKISRKTCRDRYLNGDYPARLGMLRRAGIKWRNLFR